MTTNLHVPGTSKPRSRPTKLFGIPKIEAFESPSSWISRAALSQGASPKELLEVFGISDEVDPDLMFCHLNPIDAAEMSGLPASNFEFSRRIFSNLSSIDASGKIFLKRSNGRPAYRYCAACLHFSKVKHFMVHWRFEAWRYCPLHQCLMDDRCMKCFSGISLPNHMLVSGKSRAGIDSLGRCWRCGHPLSKHWKLVLNELKRVNWRSETQEKLRAGRTLLSAIYYGYVREISDGNYKKLALNHLLALKENGVIPDEFLMLSESHFGLFPEKVKWLCEQSNGLFFPIDVRENYRYPKSH